MRHEADAATGSSSESEDDSVGSGDLGDLNPPCTSTVNFVDLAGSERMSQVANEDVDVERVRQKEVGLLLKGAFALELFEDCCLSKLTSKNSLQF